MEKTVLVFVLALVVMVAAAALFTNVVEWWAHRLELGHQLTGSVLAAIGTAMPESIVPVVALISGGPKADQTATGAILGAPLMLATIGLGLVGLVSLVCGRSKLRVGAAPSRRVLFTFVVSFALLIGGSLVPRPVRWADAALLVLLYLNFVRRTIASDQAAEGEVEQLLLARLLRRPPGRQGLALPLLQGVVALAGLAVASELFLFGIDRVSGVIHLSALVLALLLVPVATELPELASGALWIRRDLDQLALGNVTGAMAFQATVPALVGLCFTPWRPSGLGYLAAAATMLGALIGLVAASRREVDARVLAVGGLGLYLGYALAVVLVHS